MPARAQSKQESTVLPEPALRSGGTGPLLLFGQRSLGEVLCVALFASYAFLLLVCYYILKTLREPLLLEDGSAELKSYAYAVIALLLLALVPAYCQVYRRVANGTRLVRWVTGFFLVNLVGFYVAGRAGYDVGFAYYVWVGIFGITIVAQFWGYAADVFNAASGQRVFPAIAIGASLGALVGPSIVAATFATLGPWPLLLVTAGLLTLSLPLLAAARAAIPVSLRNGGKTTEPVACHLLGGLTLVLRDRYLLLLAGFVVLLNCINTTGEYLLTDLVVRHAESTIILDASLAKADLIAVFYGNFYFIVNALSLVAQTFLVGRLLRWIGVSGALLVLPIVAVIGYGLILFVPVFGVLRWFKTIENAAEYSITNTSRNALYLPLSAAAKYEGKIAIDTLFCRAGDLLQAGVIFVGLNWLGFGFRQFALLNAVLAVIWLGVALQLARRYTRTTTAAAKAELPIPSFSGCRDAVLRGTRSALIIHRHLTSHVLTVIIVLAAVALPAPVRADVEAADLIALSGALTPSGTDASAEAPARECLRYIV